MIDTIILDYIIMFILMLILTKIFVGSVSLTFVAIFNLLIGYMLTKDFNNIETIPMFILGITWCTMCYYIYSKIDYSRGGTDE